jgi:1-acyl-sn-glycerol-3-phosphate acyltransferase
MVPMRLLYRTRTMHKERFPRDGACIVAGNHASYVDPVLLALVRYRPIRFLAKSELFASPVLGWLVRGCRAFPIHRGRADREAIRLAEEILGSGGAVGIFPEGTRVGGELGEAFGGVALIALRADVPIVPVGLNGTDRIMPAGARVPRAPRVTIVFGEPIVPGDFPDGPRRERVRAITDTLMERISAAVAEGGDR